MRVPAWLAGRPARVALAAIAWAIVLGMIVYVVRPAFDHLDRWGGHDWDMVTSFRYLTVKSLRDYGQFPGWNPYACGGYTAWGYVESDTNVVSPWLPVYLLSDLRLALRVEVLGAAVISALGAWFFAGRFTRSPAARAFACVVFVVNSRWAMQAATGHAMHLYYAWTPWALAFFDRALGDPAAGAPRLRWQDAACAGAFLAMMVYSGAIYPLPQTLVALGLYAALLAAARRDLRPLAAAALAASVGLGLAAPKLLPIASAFGRHPRLTESKEAMGLDLLLDVLTSRAPVRVPQWGWHEWGMYIGWLPLLAIAAAALLVRGARETPLKCAGLALAALGQGAFHPAAPWTLLHKLPVFQSQHVPSRWLYPAVLVLGVVAAAGIGRALERLGRYQPLGELCALGLVAWMAADIGRAARPPLERAFWMQLSPKLTPRTSEFHQEAKVPPHLRYVRPDWAPPSLPGMIANTGILECWSVVPMSIFAKDESGKVPGQGARGRGDPDYRGEVYTLSGEGEAKIVSWSPNVVVVDVEGGKAGDLLVLNQNYDPGWQANGRGAESHAEAPAIRLDGGAQTVTFRYRPAYLPLGVAIFAATAAALAGAAWRGRAGQRGG
ncbi:hypothetical protein [Sorangium sp. So ce131]|uniref:hypothetical protein n=1 Tax=Sorangium sp. So ce131 TaxID=3133282 RepID=UPI003F5EE55C